MKKLASIGLLSAFIVVFSAGIAMANTFVYKEIVNWDLDDIVLYDVPDCIGEPLLLSGVWQTIFFIAVDVNGIQHVVQHYNGKGIKATGLESGDEFVEVDQFNQHVEVKGEGPLFPGNVSQVWIFLSPGSGLTFKMRGTAHMTVDGQGNTVLERGEIEAECFED